MNQPTLTALDKMLVALGSESTQLGNASMGLVKAPFTPSPTLTLGALTEATYDGYARQSMGTASVPFTGTDGKEYIEFKTLQFMPSDTINPNTIYGLFITFGNSTTTLWATDAFSQTVNLAGPANQVTITPRVGLDPNGNFGLNVVSS